MSIYFIIAYFASIVPCYLGIRYVVGQAEWTRIMKFWGIIWAICPILNSVAGIIATGVYLGGKFDDLTEANPQWEEWWNKKAKW